MAAEAPFKTQKDGIDPLLLGSVGLLLAALTFIIWRLLKLQWDEKDAKRRVEMMMAMNEAENAGNRQNRGAEVAGGMRRNARRRVNRDGDDSAGFVDHMMAAEGGIEQDEYEGDEDGGGFEYDENGKKIGKRKAAKLAAKEEKRAQREWELQEREERKRREAEKEKKREEERERERLEEEEEEERKRKEKEEKERREHEEYLALKASFAVEEEGNDVVEGEEAENLIRDFVEYVKNNKVVNIDELSAHFGLKSDESVNRLKHFIEEGLLQGVMDDRGKFIYISEEEFVAVAKFINQRGRVSINEIAEQSNRLIRLEAEIA
ncbi:unnamed protein product [Caenorhabditis angaria]|uniref:DDRGK domain-containing protein 1 n=1 Tax=Caenorhabditis angaria TaxID=860376 RepID=A0A9P1IG82_9PELO|nr:unnamed protein product [Caenorhabditis angaria]